MAITRPCPTCKKPVIWNKQSASRPFCSERCRLIDLGAWLDEDNKITEPVIPGQESGDGNDQVD